MVKNSIRASILSIPRMYKRAIVFCLDGILAFLAVWFAFYLRIGSFITLWDRVNEHYALPACIISILLSLSIFINFRLYHTIFRYSGVYAFIKIAKAISVYAFFYFLIFTLIGINGVPRTIGIIQPIIFFIFISSSRLAALYFLGDMYIKELNENKKTRALIYGTGKAGRQLMTSLMNNSTINVLGFLDQDPKFHGNQINNLTIYDPEAIQDIIAEKKIDEILLALPDNSPSIKNSILQTINNTNIQIRTIPSYTDLIEGKITINNIRPLSIEDVLGRDRVMPNSHLMKHDIKNKSVLVTGAGGSIGKELCHQILLQKPKKLILFDHSEFAIYTIFEELKKQSLKIKSTTKIISYLGSIIDKKLIKIVLRETKPQTIFHAAAYKHVPLLEENILEGVKNNVMGTLFLSQEAIYAKVKKLTLISTDKAVRPTSIMGSTKRIAEMILQALSTKQNNTIFTMVRFGNVLDSSGSVVPLFKSQIKSGGPITITHKKMTRYFMTISEAAQLVIQASAMTKKAPENGQASPIYLLDMGDPVKIHTLAKLMIELSGLTVFNKTTGKGDIEIKTIGIRPGEKLHEELLIVNNTSETSHPKIKYANEYFLDWDKLSKYLSKIKTAINKSDEDLITKLLRNLMLEHKEGNNKKI